MVTSRNAMRSSEEYVQELRRDAEAGVLHPLKYTGFLDALLATL
jgi:hypothetical protein